MMNNAVCLSSSSVCLEPTQAKLKTGQRLPTTTTDDDTDDRQETHTCSY
jgi:hypothetical protein